MATRLKLTREARGLHAYAIARVVGITRSQYSLIEGGHVRPAPWLAVRIAQVLGLGSRDLFPEEGEYEQHESAHSAHQGTSSASPGGTTELRSRRGLESASDDGKQQPGAAGVNEAAGRKR